MGWGDRVGVETAARDIDLVSDLIVYWVGDAHERTSVGGPCLE